MSVKYSELADFIRVDVIHYLFTKSDRKVLILCPDKKKAKEVYNSIFIGFCQLQLHDYISRHITSEIQLLNGSHLQVIYPDENGSGSWICGQMANKAYVIEKQNFSEECMEEILCSLYPAISTTGGEIFGV